MRTALLAAPGVEALAPEDRERLVAGIVGSCEAYLGDRAVQAGTRSGDIAARLALAETRARELAGAIEALDGVGWGLLGRALAGTAGEDPATEPVAGSEPAQALRSLRRVSAALAEAAAVARGAPQLSPARSRLMLASGVARALLAARLPLFAEAEGLLDRCTRAAFAALGLEPPEAMEDLLMRAARVARRSAPPEVPGQEGLRR